MQCSVSIYCPEMKIWKTDRGHKKTAEEPMVATITCPGSFILTIPNVVIPETVVTKKRLWSWAVAACIGTGSMSGAYLETRLPEEPTIWEWMEFTMVAQSIKAYTVLTYLGKIYRGYVTFPRCRIGNIFSDPNIAEAVTATGLLSDE